MPSETGYWNTDEIIYHDYSFPLARWIAKFFDYTNVRAVDFGCGDGFYAGYLQDLGYAVTPVEGNKETVVYADDAIEQDLTQSFTIPCYYGICLEVGEHIPEEFEQVFIDNIANNTKGKLVLSWAIPEQEGYFHVNCKPNEWVIAEFEKRGFKFLPKETGEVRAVIEERRSYFRNTLLVFTK